MTAPPIDPDFKSWQPIYAALNIATFPVAIGEGVKRPAIRGYLKIGSERSQQLATQFPDAQAFGFVCGERSGVTVLDIDSTDEKIAADAFDRHGKTPLIVRSGSGHFQGWYRYGGEGRKIRPDKSQPIDVLGRGFVVAPPSRGRAGSYEIIQGSLDDLDRLPALRQPTAQIAAETERSAWQEMGAGAGRNGALFRKLATEAHCCDDLDQLLDRARALNDDFAVPLPDAEIVKLARSVWRMTTEGRNRFGQHGAYFPINDVQHLIADPYLLSLLAWLRAHNGPAATFMVADGLAYQIGFPRRRFTQARNAAIRAGYIRQVSRPADGRAARYRWPTGGGLLASGPLVGPLASPPPAVLEKREGREETVLVEDHLPKTVGLKHGDTHKAGLPKVVGLKGL